MKRLFLFTIMSFLMLISQAQTFTVNTTGGDLGTKLDAQGVTASTAITELKINGTLNESDFTTLASETYGLRAKITTMDLTGVTALENNALPERAFLWFSVLTNLKLPQNVITTVGHAAFRNMAALRSLELPNSITTIGEQVFYYSGLVEFTFPNSVTSIGPETFAYCADIKKVTLPSKLIEIPDMMFTSCPNLEKVVIPEGLKKIKRQAFKNTGSSDILSLSVNIPNSVTNIDGYQLFNSSSIASITLPSGVEYVPAKSNGTAITDPAEFERKKKWISTNMFAYAKRLISVTLPDDITGIDNGAFQGTAITSITFPKSLIAFGTTALYDEEWNAGSFKGTRLVDVVIPDNVIDLGSNTFQEILTLKKITLGEKLDKIGAYALFGNTALETIIIKSDWPPILGTQALQGIPKNVVIYVPDAEAVTAYKNADGWKDFTNYKIIGADAVDSDIENFSDMTVEKGASAITLNASLKDPNDKREIKYSIEAGKGTVATLNGKVLTIVGEGTAKITALAEGNIDFKEAKKEITVTVVDVSYLEEATILISGNRATLVGPTEKVSKFTKFFVNDAEVELKSGVADLTDKTGELSLKATTADGSEVIKLKINKQ